MFRLLPSQLNLLRGGGVGGKPVEPPPDQIVEQEEATNANLVLAKGH